MQDFTGKVIVVTGGANGIGACIAHTFVGLGASVIFSDNDEFAGKARQAALNEQAGAVRALFIKADLADSDQVEGFLHATLQQHAAIDVLINNAGIFSATTLAKRPLSEWDRMLAVNLRATYQCAQLFMNALITNKGNIINVASTRAIMSEADTEPYSASKGGVVALTHSLAITLGKYGVRVNCISPGWIETADWHLPARKKTLRSIDHQQHPVGRVGKPEDIAQACVFLSSNVSAGFITGHNLIVDGGMTRKMLYVE